jgi:putative SOS response-associated peptidase YedK
MCGRIALYDDPDHLARLLDAGVDPALLSDWKPAWNVAPTDSILGVSERRGDRTLRSYSWGLVPSWANDPSAIKGTFNARAESVATKPTFRTAFRKGRILVPVDAFYEWKTCGRKQKQPYAFRRADGEPIVFAGLREWWRGDDGTVLNTATIITTVAGPDMPIHNRQPVVLERTTWDHWLDPEVSDPEELEPLLVPTVEGTLINHPVGKGVGNVRNDGPELMEAVAVQEDLGLNSL